MVFNDTTNKDGVIQECERYCNLGATGISSNTNNLYDFTSYCNATLRSLWHTSFLKCGNWLYEDNNQTDLPQSTTDLVSGRATYALPSEALTIRRVEVQDSAGIWTELSPLSLKEIPNAVDEFAKNDSQPLWYRLVGNTMELFPASNYGATDGLKVYYDRGSVAFAYNDTTKAPGIASEYHDLIPMGASLRWLKIKTPGGADTQQLQNDFLKRELEYGQYLSQRFRDKVSKVGRRNTSFK